MLNKYENEKKQNNYKKLTIPIYCINLPYRNDRWKLIQQEYHKFTNKIYRVNSINHINSIVSCGLSFLKCILLAKKGNLKQILICEDDVTFHGNSIKIWNISIKQLPNDWDILLGGLSNFKPIPNNKHIYPNLIKIKDFSGEHMMLVNEKAYNKLLTYIDNLKTPAKILHFDRFLGNLSKQNQLNIYCCVPFVSVPICHGYSNIRNKYVNDEPYFKVALIQLMKMINKN